MKRNDPAVVVCDAGPLIHLDELRCLHLLRPYGQILVPKTVWDEVRRNRSQALRRTSVSLNRVESIPEPSESLASLMHVFNLDAGEKEALRLMERHPGAILVSDDLAARRVAGQLQYKFYGTIGILLSAISRRQLAKQKVIQLLQMIPAQTTLHIRAALLADFIEQVQKQQT